MELRIFIEPQQGATYGEQLAVARATEAAGLGALFRSDHLRAIGANWRTDAGPTDAWVTLAGLARETERIRLGTLMTSATFRHPGALAVVVAEVDAMSGGRVELGIGAGWYEAEHRAFGIPFGTSMGERFARLEEQLAILTGIWSTPVGSSFGFAGAHYRLEDCPGLTRPTQARLPIIVGGRGTLRTPGLAARYAAECNLPFQGVDAARTLFRHLDAACDREGRDRGEVVRSVVLTTAIGATVDEARGRAEAIGRDPAELDRSGLIGTSGEVAERCAAYAAIGTGRIYLQLLDLLDLEQIALIGAELAPAVSGL